MPDADTELARGVKARFDDDEARRMGSDAPTTGMATMAISAASCTFSISY